MKRFTSWLMAFLFLAGMLPTALGSAPLKTLVVGIALGYPPYQYTNELGSPAGIDADITRLVFRELGISFQFNQQTWDEIYLGLLHNIGEVDLLCGAELNEERKAYFDFTEAYYQRTVVIFVRSESPYQNLADLQGKLITGDRGGQIETLLNRNLLRITNTESKVEGFKKLKNGQVQAVIAPLEVGNWICKDLGLAVRLLPERDPGSPVAFAVAKGNTELAAQLNAALKKLKQSGAIEAVFKKYR